MRYVPLVATLLLYAIAGFWRPWLQYRRHGASGFLLLRSGGLAQKVRDAGTVLVFTLLLAQAGMTLGRTSPSLLVSPATSTGLVLSAIGAALMLAGLVLLVVGQLHLGASWRIGIEAGAKPGLVTDGLYRVCRNPIFLGLLVFVTGYALMLPTILSLVLLVALYVGIRQQIAAEEVYLTDTYGDTYRDYARRVGRFLPGIGKLR